MICSTIMRLPSQMSLLLQALVFTWPLQFGCSTVTYSSMFDICEATFSSCGNGSRQTDRQMQRNSLMQMPWHTIPQSCLRHYLCDFEDHFCIVTAVWSLQLAAITKLWRTDTASVSAQMLILVFEFASGGSSRLWSLFGNHIFRGRERSSFIERQ